MYYIKIKLYLKWTTNKSITQYSDMKCIFKVIKMKKINKAIFIYINQTKIVLMY